MDNSIRRKRKYSETDIQIKEEEEDLNVEDEQKKNKVNNAQRDDNDIPRPIQQDKQQHNETDMTKDVDGKEEGEIGDNPEDDKIRIQSLDEIEHLRSEKDKEKMISVMLY
ncbi:MAG: hypothetical protein EZS28_055581 [Streblomastix strix]|uniref:Uncharacterized protein n=1 Tax=Streblomastix strix TaxID=222440 RepID=A0A5J4PXX2_9EUKA|nr:MAG: hypothetical protein EZS28_055581 [Streblomastix strix]